jgi:hypothetical protein
LKEISNVLTLVYKEEGNDPKAYSFTSETEAIEAKLMIQGSDGGELIDEHGNVNGCIKIEWCYLIKGKLINS